MKTRINFLPSDSRPFCTMATLAVEDIELRFYGMVAAIPVILDGIDPDRAQFIKESVFTFMISEMERDRELYRMESLAHAALMVADDKMGAFLAQITGGSL